MEELDKRIDFTFFIISSIDPHLDWAIRDIRFNKWTEETEVSGISQMDIGLMPLNDTEFERGKCGFKAIQYMAAGIPPIVSPVGINTTLVEHGFDGFHAYNYEEWVHFLEKLAFDPELRVQMGTRARFKVENAFSLSYAVDRWKHLLYRVIDLY